MRGGVGHATRWLIESEIRSHPILRFDEEAFVGGLFGIGRTYGSLAHIEIETIDSHTALRKIAEWRTAYGDRAKSANFHFLAAHNFIDDVQSHLGEAFFAKRPKEFIGLKIDGAVFD